MSKSSTASVGLRSRYQKLSSSTRSLLKFLGVILLLTVLGLIYHFNTDQSIESTQKFFEQRKQFQEYHNYKKEEETAKKKAERNIFLQD